MTRLLNFLNRGFVPGRVITVRMYAKISKKYTGKNLKQHHHTVVDREFKHDCGIWLQFLNNSNSIVPCRPSIDVEVVHYADQLHFYTDSSANARLGFGCVFGNHWTYRQWEPGFVRSATDPGIAYLELYAVYVGIFTWRDHLKIAL